MELNAIFCLMKILFCYQIYMYVMSIYAGKQSTRTFKWLEAQYKIKSKSFDTTNKCHWQSKTFTLCINTPSLFRYNYIRYLQSDDDFRIHEIFATNDHHYFIECKENGPKLKKNKKKTKSVQHFNTHFLFRASASASASIFWGYMLCVLLFAICQLCHIII